MVKQTSAANIRAELVRLRARKTKLNAIIRSLEDYAKLVAKFGKKGRTPATRSVGQSEIKKAA